MRSRHWFASRADRLNGRARIGGVDLARGLAIVGMFAAHLLVIPGPLRLGDPETWLGVVNGRSSILFATLAGVSIAVMTGGTTPVTGDRMTVARLRLALRAIVLWVVGILLVITGVPVFVILPAYALMFLVAIVFTGMRARSLLVLAGVFALVLPAIQVLLDSLSFWQTHDGVLLGLAIGWHYPFTTWIAFVLAGMGVTRLGLERVRVQWGLLAAGTALAVVGYGMHALTGSDIAEEHASFVGALWTARAHSTGLLEVVGSGGLALAVIAGCLLLCRTWVFRLSLPLRATGAMPLSAYTAQLVVWWLVALLVLGYPGDLAGFRALDPFWPLTLGVIAGCTAWALLVGRGPLEWAIDRLTRFAVPASRSR